MKAKEITNKIVNCYFFAGMIFTYEDDPEGFEDFFYAHLMRKPKIIPKIKEDLLNLHKSVVNVENIAEIQSIMLGVIKKVEKKSENN